MGFLNLFKTGKRVIDAKADQAAEKIASENAVEFGKQDVDKMKSELRKANNNIGTIKGEMAVLNDKIGGIKNQIKKHDDDATALSEGGQEKLAIQHCDAAEALESQLEPLTMAMKTQKDLLAQQMESKNQLSSAITQAESDLVTLKAMTDAAKANENLATINTDSGTSALADFQKRKEDAKKRLVKSQAIRDEGKPDTSLADATSKALGNSGSNARLARLKNKK